jgi:hypothetical protein
MAQVARPACTGSRLGAYLQGGARVIRCCGEKLGAARGSRLRRRPRRGATAMRSAGQHARTDHCPLSRRGTPTAPREIR